MKRIKEEELKNLNGGISAWGAIGIGALAAFLAGVSYNKHPSWLAR